MLHQWCQSCRGPLPPPTHLPQYNAGLSLPPLASQQCWAWANSACFFLFEISTYTLWRKITYGESGISLQTRWRWYDKQINHYLLWAFHGSGGEGRSERQNKEYAAGDKQNRSIAHIAQRIAALSRHEFGMRKEIQEWIFFFFYFNEGGFGAECHETIRILERKKTTVATFFHFLFFLWDMNNVKQGITIHFLFFFFKNDQQHTSHLLGKGKENFKKCLQTGQNHDTLHWFTKKSTQCLSLLSVQWGNQVIPSTLKQPMTVQNHCFGR